MVRRFSNGSNLRGVNLGGWLVLEKWITPSLFEGLQAADETTYCVELGEAEATRRLHHHWNTFIIRDDFAWLQRVGINAVRLPIGHWLFGKNYPYHASYKEARYPFVQGGIEIVDKVFQWAAEFGLRVVLDLHAAPGCQNGFDNGGILGVCEWHTKDEYIQHSLDVLELMAERYNDHPALKRYSGHQRAGLGSAHRCAQALHFGCLSAHSPPLCARARDVCIPRWFPQLPGVCRFSAGAGVSQRGHRYSPLSML